jgi:hypothetical protein
MISVCSVGVPILPSRISISLLFHKQPGRILLTFPSHLFDSVRLVLECDPLDYFSNEVDILWALMGEAHI